MRATTLLNRVLCLPKTSVRRRGPRRSGEGMGTSAAAGVGVSALRVHHPAPLRYPGGGLVVAAPGPGWTRLCAHDAPPATALPRARGAGRGGGLRPPRIRVHSRLRGPGGVAGHQDRQVHRGDVLPHHLAHRRRDLRPGRRRQTRPRPIHESGRDRGWTRFRGAATTST